MNKKIENKLENLNCDRVNLNKMSMKTFIFKENTEKINAHNSLFVDSELDPSVKVKGHGSVDGATLCKHKIISISEIQCI